MKKYAILVLACLIRVVEAGTGQSKTKEELVVQSAQEKDLAGLKKLVLEDEETLHWAVYSRQIEVVKKVLRALEESKELPGVVESLQRKSPLLKLKTIQHKNAICAVAWSPDSSMICTGSADNTAQVWDVAKKEVVATIQHNATVLAVAWSPDGSKICTGSGDKTAQVWDVAKKEVIATIQHKRWVNAVAWSPDGSKICTSSDDSTAQVWDVAKKEVVATIQHNATVLAVAWSPDGSKICTGSGDKTAQVWDVAKKEVIATIQHKRWVNAVAWSPDGSKICTSSDDSTAQVWDVAKKEVVATIQHNATVLAVAWSPDGSKICTGSGDKTAQVWDVAKKEVVVTIQHKGWVNAVAWSPDSSKICTGSFDKTALVWQMGGTPLDLAIREACDGADVMFVKELLDLDVLKPLQTFCSATRVDYVIRRIPSSANGVEVLRILLEKCDTLEGLCSKCALTDLIEVLKVIEESFPDRYKSVKNLFAPIIEKGSGWLDL